MKVNPIDFELGILLNALDMTEYSILTLMSINQDNEIWSQEDYEILRKWDEQIGNWQKRLEKIEVEGEE